METARRLEVDEKSIVEWATETEALPVELSLLDTNAVGRVGDIVLGNGNAPVLGPGDATGIGTGTGVALPFRLLAVAPT